jgi:hypothetical protein
MDELRFEAGRPSSRFADVRYAVLERIENVVRQYSRFERDGIQ